MSPDCAAGAPYTDDGDDVAASAFTILTRAGLGTSGPVV